MPSHKLLTFPHLPTAFLHHSHLPTPSYTVQDAPAPAVPGWRVAEVRSLNTEWTGGNVGVPCRTNQQITPPARHTRRNTTKKRGRKHTLPSRETRRWFSSFSPHIVANGDHRTLDSTSLQPQMINTRGHARTQASANKPNVVSKSSLCSPPLITDIKGLMVFAALILGLK